MLLKTKLLVGAGLLALVLGGLGFKAWLDHHDAVLKMQDTIAEQQRIIQGKDADIKARDAAAVAAKQEIDRQVAAAKTPRQNATLLNQWVRPTKPIEVPAPLPDSPGTVAGPVVLDESQLRDLTVFAGKCKQCDVDKAALEGNVTDWKAKFDAVSKERDVAVAVAKGGTRMQRLKRALLPIACAAGGAAAGARAKGPGTAALGAAGAAALCSVIQ
jgi:hypothetical protein